jgi:hypothetical protein
VRRLDREQQALFYGIRIRLVLETQHFQIFVGYISILRVAWIQQYILLFSFKSCDEIIKLSLRFQYFLILQLGCDVAFAKLRANTVLAVVNLLKCFGIRNNGAVASTRCIF